MDISECGIDYIGDDARENISHGTYAFPLAIYLENLEDEEIPWHWHVELELILVSEGQGLFSCNGQENVLSAGQGMFINGGNLHGCRCKEGEHCRIRSIVFHPRIVSGGTDTAIWQRYIQPLTENQTFPGCCLDPEEPWQEEILDLIADVWENAYGENEGFEFTVRSGLSDILFLLYRHMDPPQTGSHRNITRINRLKIMMDYIQLHYQEDIHLEDVADAANISESESRRCFQSILNTTPGKYITEIRLQKACELLSNTSIPVSRIAGLCGFTDQSYFGKLFKKEKKMTPRQYRLDQ